ncbi:MAG: class I SAM-dependent methyltransferase [Chloroflexi bacterium]|nr:class I SAM-dependent methyltransferase [Chloroflexota bacterium]
MQDLVRAGYDAIAEQYLAARPRDGADMALLEDLAARLSPGAHILDAGCGAGVPVAQRLAQRFAVTGVDLSQAQVDLARRLVPAASFLCGDMTRLSFPAASFDAVVSFYAVIHVPREQHRDLLLNFHRMLKPGGLLLVTMGRSDAPGDTDNDFFGAPMYWSHYDAPTNQRLAGACGFQVLQAVMVPETLPPPHGSPQEPGAHLFLLAQKQPPTLGTPHPQ